MTSLCPHQMPEPLCRECKPIDTRIEVPGSTLKMRPPKQKERKPLKKSVKKRPMKPEAMSELLADVLLRDGRCVAIDHTETMCDGPSEAHHLIPQRILRKHYPEGHEIFSDKANVVALCSRHHSNVERHILNVPNDVLPEGFHTFCEVHGFDTWMDAEAARRVA